MLGKKIRAARKIKGMKQSELAALTGVSTMTINRIENERFNFQISTLENIMEVLDLKIDSPLSPEKQQILNMLNEEESDLTNG